MRTNGSRWKTNCCGIFCAPQEGSVAKSKIWRNLPSQKRISGIRYVSFFSGIQKWIHPFLQPRAHPTKNWSGAAHAAPLQLKLYIFLLVAFLCCPHNLGRFKDKYAFFMSLYVDPQRTKIPEPFARNRRTSVVSLKNNPVSRTANRKSYQSPKLMPISLACSMAEQSFGTFFSFPATSLRGTGIILLFTTPHI